MNQRWSLNLPGVQALSQAAANAAILILWLWLFRPVYAYLGIIFTRQEFRTNQIVLLAVLALVIFQVRRGDLQPRLNSLPHLYFSALALVIGCSILFLLAERFLDINTLSATLFGLATYGLLGLWLRPAYWRAGLPAALLLIGTLPFGEHMDTFVGYPLRIATARLVSQGLAGLGFPNLGVDTILIFENGVSQVDNPCSGVKSLWTGALFFLAATWIDRRPLNRRWLLAALIFAGLLMVANLGRVALLVLTGQVYGLRLLAQMLHVPLGVIGFAAACAAALVMLRWAGTPRPASQDQPEDDQISLDRPAWLSPALILVFLGMVLLYAPRAQPAAAASRSAWVFPRQLQTTPWPLTTGELNWLTQDAQEASVQAARWRFTWGDLQGSLLFVTSDTWRAQHRPERCFTVYGLDVQESLPWIAADDFPLRWLTLGYGKDPALYSAAYWLQSSDRITEDYAARIWDDLAPKPEPWVLVTVLFDDPVDLNSDAAREMFVTLRATVQDSLVVSGQDAIENDK